MAALSMAPHAPRAHAFASQGEAPGTESVRSWCVLPSRFGSPSRLQQGYERVYFPACVAIWKRSV